MAELEIVSEEASCTATAIGPHAILTATHCDKSDRWIIRNGDNFAVAQIVERITDAADHSIFLLDGVTFVDLVKVNLNDPADMAENVFTIGNPGNFKDYYQRGYIQGFMPANPDKDIPRDELLYSFPSFSGASGSGIFNENGELIDVISQVIPQTLPGEYMQSTGGFPLNFKTADIDRAVTFVPKK